MVENLSETGLVGAIRDLGGGTASYVGAGISGFAPDGANYGIASIGKGSAIAVFGQHTDASSTDDNFGQLGDANNGVYGEQIAGNISTGAGVQGVANLENGTGVIGEANNGSSAYGVWGKSSSGQAGHFDGDVQINGTLIKTGGSFKIDHPLDPAGKYLSHSFVESPDMMNVYNGNIALDAGGEAWVEMPDWFEALNREFRYQLTAIGAPGPSLPVAAEMADNRFKIAGGAPGMKVSWQVTGIRQDPWAEANRIEVEQAKPPAETGLYLHPGLYGQTEEKNVESRVKGSKAPAKAKASKTPQIRHIRRNDQGLWVEALAN